MEDEVIQTTQPTSDVVVTANTSPENTAGYMQVQEPVAQQPETLSPETIMHNERLNSYASKGESIRNWINNDYNYNKNDAGTLWVAGAINDVNTQMSFLEATLNEDLYDEMDLQKYFFDQNLATARAYAKEKKSETAYGFYKAAQEKATAEGELTGWYMPPEAGYMLGQWTIAKENLKDPNISAEDRARAESVVRATQGWFDANNITERGIECLNNLYLKETIRHNQETEELQRQANNIAAQKANASASSYDLSLREFKYQQAEMELKYGADINKDAIIGHTDEFAYRGQYTTQVEWIEAGHMGAAIDMWGTDHVKGILGDRYTEFNRKYESDNTYKTARKEIASKGKISEDSKVFKNTGQKTKDGYDVKYVVVNNKVVVGYFDEHGAWNTITNSKATFKNGDNIQEYIEKLYGKGSMDKTGIDSVEVDGEVYAFGKYKSSGDVKYTDMEKNGWKKETHSNQSTSVEGRNDKKINETIRKATSSEGVKDSDGNKVKDLDYAYGYMDSKGYNDYTLLKGKDKDNNTVFYRVTDDGELVKMKNSDIKKIDRVEDTYKKGDIWETTWDGFKDGIGDNKKTRIAKSSWIYKCDDGETAYAVVLHDDGSHEIVKLKAVYGKQKDTKGNIVDTNYYRVEKIGVDYTELKKNGIAVPDSMKPKASSESTESLTLNSYESETEVTDEAPKEKEKPPTPDGVEAPNNNPKQPQNPKKEVRRLSKTSEEQVLEDAQTVTPFNKKDEEEENNKFTGQFLATV